MRISADGLTDATAIEAGLAEMSDEVTRVGGQVYLPVIPAAR